MRHGDVQAEGRFRQVEVEPASASRDVLELLQDLRERDRDRERRERERYAGEPLCRQAECVAEEARDQPGDRDFENRVAPVAERQPARWVVAEQLHAGAAKGQKRRRVRPDPEECIAAERDLAAVADEDVEPDERDEVDPHVREPLQDQLADMPREKREGEDERADDDEIDGGERASHQTLRTTACPNSPCGRMTSTTSRTASALGRRSVEPMKST